MKQPPIITYNLKDRDRKYRGVERNFDIPAIVRAINSNECQERVHKRDMLGFLGHWVRIRFGLEPPEGGIINGKVEHIEPAIVTTHLKAYPNGDVEHKTEFLDTKTGQIAARMYANRVGGFSSAIDENNPKFFGFDWVNDPNYSTNRGYSLVLDSVTSGQMTLDDIMVAEYQDQITAMSLLLERSEYREKLALDSAQQLSVENEELLSMLASGNNPVNKVGSKAALNQFLADKTAFDSVVTLPTFAVPVTEQSKKEEQELRMIKNRMIKNV